MTAEQGASRALVFGATGALGSEIVNVFKKEGRFVAAVVRQSAVEVSADHVILLDGQMSEAIRALGNIKFDAVVWAQGANLNDSIDNFDRGSFDAIMSANLGFVVESMAALLDQEKIATPARLCVISSIWQYLAREQKFSYTVSKAALGGFVRATSADLAKRQILVNAVLPGVIDTPMTRSVLTAAQVRDISSATGFDRLATAKDIAETVAFLCSAKNNAITGQSVPVDLGFGHVRKL